MVRIWIRACAAAVLLVGVGWAAPAFAQTPPAIAPVDVKQVKDELDRLRREFEVMRLLSSGKTVSQIAESMHLGTTTVSTYRSRILEKLHLKNNAELMRYAVQQGIG